MNTTLRSPVSAEEGFQKLKNALDVQTQSIVHYSSFSFRGTIVPPSFSVTFPMFIFGGIILKLNPIFKGTISNSSAGGSVIEGRFSYRPLSLVFWIGQILIFLIAILFVNTLLNNPNLVFFSASSNPSPFITYFLPVTLLVWVGMIIFGFGAARSGKKMIVSFLKNTLGAV